MRLLIAFDGSDGSDAALHDLRWAGLPETVEATVLTVADVWLPQAEKGDGSALLPWMAVAGREALARATGEVEHARALAARAAGRIRGEFPGWKVREDAAADSPAWGIVTKAQTWEADLVLVGSNERSPLERLGLGSVSQKVAAEAPCSVRIGRGLAGEDGGPARIIVGVDGSPEAEDAAREAARRAWPAGTEIRLLSIVDSRLGTALARDDHPAHRWMREADKDNEAWLERMAESLVSELSGRGHAVSHVTKSGDAKRALVEEAERWGAHSLFIGARSLDERRPPVLGSVAASVANRARCSVEIVRSRRGSASV